MKQFSKYSIIALALCSDLTFAANPISGWYAGIILGGSYAPKETIVFPNPLTANSTACSNTALCGIATGELAYSGYGNIGGFVGIRRNNFRIELQPVVNYNPYQTITVGNTEFTSPKSSEELRLKGSTTTGAVMVNGFYDFNRPNCDADLVPYIGAGAGVAQVNNRLEFFCNDQSISCTKISDRKTTAAVQGIAGAAYFMDDFTWFGLDYRYITTQNIDIIGSRLQIHTLNLSFSGMFNCFF